MNNLYIDQNYNPFELNSIWFDERSSLRALVPDGSKTVGSIRFFTRCALVILRVMVGTIFKNPSSLFVDVNRRWRSLSNKLIFFIPTSNNIKAVSSITKELSLQNKEYVVIDKPFDPQYFPMVQISMVSFSYIGWLTHKYKYLDDFDKRILLYYLSFFVLCPGITWFYMKVLKDYKPQCIVFANDHLPYCRSLALVCEDYSIRTIYVQHASVSSAFPELHFTHSFLDGMDSLVKYTEKPKDSRGEVILLGALRYDPLSRYRVNRIKYQRHCIGIAINDLDNNDVANKFCNALLKQYPGITLKVRSHPALKNTPFVFDNKERIKYTCATDESITDYFDSIDLQISGDSGVHFDAIIGGVPTLVYNFASGPFLDNYKYVEKGLIHYANNVEEVFDLLSSNQQEVDDKLLNYYDASYGKVYAGNCSKIVAEFIINGYELSFLKDAYGLEKGELGNKTFYIIPR